MKFTGNTYIKLYLLKKDLIRQAQEIESMLIDFDFFDDKLEDSIKNLISTGYFDYPRFASDGEKVLFIIKFLKQSSYSEILKYRDILEDENLTNINIEKKIVELLKQNKIIQKTVNKETTYNIWKQ